MYGGQKSRGGYGNNNFNRASNISSRIDFTSDNLGPLPSYGQSTSDYNMQSCDKTPEQLAFDIEFNKWEQSFNDWKSNNKYHADPEQYKFYEKKFTDVREKLLEKRRVLYRYARESQFENQLSAADAMAKSILSKFSENLSFDDSSRNYEGNMNPGYGPGPVMGTRGNYYNGGGGSGCGRSMGQGGYGRDLGRGMSQVGYGPPPLMGMNARFGPGPFLRPYNHPGPYDRPFDRRRNNKKPNKNDNSKNKPSADTTKSNKKKSKKNKTTDAEPKGRVLAPYYERLDDIIKEAREAECPRLISGAGTKRLREIRAKKQEELNENELKLLDFEKYVSAKRAEFFAAKDAKEKAEAEKAEAEKASNLEESRVEKTEEDQTMAEAE